MRSTSVQSERLLPSNPQQAARRAAENPSEPIGAAITGPEAIGLAIFCALGLLLTSVFNLVVPNFAEVAASLQPYF